MSTYVVTFLGNVSESFRGRVRHVATGEEAKFSTVTDLLGFFEEMNATSGLSTTSIVGRDAESDLEGSG